VGYDLKPVRLKSRLSIIEGCDFDSFPTGGVLPFLQNCLRYEHDALDIKLVGLTTDRKDKIGQWRPCRIGNKEYQFIPVAFCSKNTAEHPSFVPNRVKMLVGLYSHIFKILKASDIVYVHSPELALPFVFWGRHKRLVVHVHGIPDYAAMNSRYLWVRSGLISKLYRKCLDIILRRADKVIWVSNDGLIRYSGHSDLKNKSIVIPTSVDINMFTPMDKATLRKKYNIPSDIRLIGFLGRLNNSKRPELVLAAFKHLVARHHDVSLIYIGDGELRNSLEIEARNEGLSDRVIFMGKVIHKDVAERLNLIDVGCFPSKIGEGFPLTVLEILACGIPVIASEVADLMQVIRPGCNGYLVNSDSPIDFAGYIELALTHSCDMAASCIATAKEYSAEQISKRLFNEVVKD
jgi:glycosyltransferase involved in cell wall biosynthesis